MIYYWQNGRGDCCITRALFLIKYLKLVFSLIVLSWRLKIGDWDLMHGEVFSKKGMLFKEVLSGGLEMKKKC